MTPSPSNPLAGVRWLATTNDSGEEMPAHACVVVDSSGDEGQFVISKPTTASEHVWIAGPTPALDGDCATAVNTFPIDALYDSADGTPAVGEIWGAGAGTWKLKKNNTGFRVCGTPDTVKKVVPVERYVEASSGSSVFAANLTEATGAASWQSRTLSAGAWANDTPTGTNNAYPVQCGGAAFTPGATCTSIMWEEPAGSGVYAFLPIQYTDGTVPGFVSVSAQTFNGVKTFSNTPLAGAYGFSGGGSVTNTGTGGGTTRVGAIADEFYVAATGTYGIYTVKNLSTGTTLNGWSGTFATGDARTVTVTGGIITNVA